MSELDLASNAGPPPRRHKVKRRVRQRTQQPDVKTVGRDPRLLRVAAGTLVTGFVLVVLLACSGGSGGIGTPTVGVAGTNGSVNVANYTDSRIKLAMCGIPSFSFGTAAADANGAVQVEELSGGAQFVVLIGFGGAMPVHFWMGMTGGEDP